MNLRSHFFLISTFSLHHEIESRFSFFLRYDARIERDLRFEQPRPHAEARIEGFVISDFLILHKKVRKKLFLIFFVLSSFVSCFMFEFAIGYVSSTKSAENGDFISRGEKLTSSGGENHALSCFEFQPNFSTYRWRTQTHRKPLKSELKVELVFFSLWILFMLAQRLSGVFSQFLDRFQPYHFATHFNSRLSFVQVSTTVEQSKLFWVVEILCEKEWNGSLRESFVDS